jgi:hypothetical protein
MARRVFFSFHYERDVIRASQVRNSWVTKGGGSSAGFWDKAQWETVRRGGGAAIKRWINLQIKGTTVTVVLIGSETYKRGYVKYEIQRSVEVGNGILGIYIHRLKNFQKLASPKGISPFAKLSYDLGNGKRLPMSRHIKTYDWVLDDGYKNLGKWIEAAARQAGL